MRNIGLVLMTLALGGCAAGSKPSQPTLQRPEPTAMAAPDGGTPGPELADGGSPRPGLDKEQIRETIVRYRGHVRWCFDVALGRVPGPLQGKIAMRFTIIADGSVSAPEAVQNTVGDEELAQCIATKMTTWRFPPLVDGGKVVVTYPFIFKSTEEPDAGIPDAGP